MFLVPETVNGLSLTAVSLESISLQWHRVSGTASVYYIVTWTSKYATGSKVVMNNKNSATINGLMSNDQYHFQVQATNQGGTPGNKSNQESFVTSK